MFKAYTHTNIYTYKYIAAYEEKIFVETKYQSIVVKSEEGAEFKGESETQFY